jgi:hypothetical protein
LLLSISTKAQKENNDMIGHMNVRNDQHIASGKKGEERNKKERGERKMNRIVLKIPVTKRKEERFKIK